MRKPSRREWALLGLAAMAAVLTVDAYRGDGENAMPVAAAAQTVKSKGEAHRAAEFDELDLSQLQRVAHAGETGNVFAGKSWYVPPPPPPPPKPLPPPPPAAPPLPFTYLGRYEDPVKPVIYLVRGDRVLLVSAGEVIEGTYRVDGIAGRTLALTYLPLNIRQTLDIGNAG